MNIQRYEFSRCSCSEDNSEMYPSDQGDWVQYNDARKELLELEKQLLIKQVQNQVRHSRQIVSWWNLSCEDFNMPPIPKFVESALKILQDFRKSEVDTAPDNRTTQRIIAQTNEMTDKEVYDHLQKWLKNPVGGPFFYPTDSCGYKQHCKFIDFKNRQDQTLSLHQLIVLYCDVLVDSIINNL